MRELFVLSAGAAKAVVLALKPAFEGEESVTLQATFGAVGAMRDQWVAGAPCDVLILTAKLLDDLAHDGAVDARVSLGRVRTGIAVRAGSALPPIVDGDDLRSSFLGATSLYLPDPQRATAGIHCVEVLQRLGILTTIESRLRQFPNGAAAMAGLASASDERAIGCTQVTEILYTPGVTLVGALPPGFELNTEYAAAVVVHAREATLARRFVARLGGDDMLAILRAGGFEA